MPVPNYSAMDLALFSTVIACGARLRGWSLDIGVGGGLAAVQEVQCMRMKDGLYIAGNHNEHLAIADYLRAFGVSDHASLLSCVKHTYWLLNTAHGQRNADVGRGYVAAFSVQEQATLNYAAASLPLITPMSAADILTARTLVTTAVLPAGPLRSLAWFLRKFTGAAAIAGLNRPVATNFNLLNNYAGPNEVNLLNSGTTVHAELKLMRLLAQVHISNALRVTEGDVAVGGLKRACAYCGAWLGHFAPWMRAQYRLTVSLPAGDNRAVGGGAGTRPTGVGEGGFGNYVGALFNGAANDACADIAGHAGDAEW